MGEQDRILRNVYNAARTGQIRISLHAAEEAVAEHTSSQLLEALASAVILEEYPTWWLGPCCLVHGRTAAGRDLHMVSSYETLPIVIITIYEPQPPRWLSPTERGDKV